MSADPVETAASRVDATGVRETVRFFGSNLDRIIGSLHDPGGARQAVVVCPSILTDFTTQYRHEVLFARLLASRGFAVMRFQYRGTGNSDGDGSTMTFEGMIEDTLDACSAVTGSTGISDISLLGTRFGALVAAEAARRLQMRTLALWEPVLDGLGYFREANRATLMHAVSKGGRRGSTFDDLVVDIHRDGFVDILGYTLDEALFDGSRDRTLEGALGPHLEAVQISQVGPRKELRKPYVALSERLRTLGCEVDLRSVYGGEPWWMTHDGWTPIESRPHVRDLVEGTVDWFAGALVARSG